MNIAVIQRFLPSQSRGGAGHFAHGLSNTLVARGHVVTVFSQDPAPEDAQYRVRQVAHPQVTRLAPLWFPFQVAGLDFSGFDVIHAQGDDQWLPRHRVPVVRTLHGSALSEAVQNGWRGRSPKRFALHLYFYANDLVAAVRADAVVAVSRHTTRFYPRARLVIPNGVELNGLPSRAKSTCPSVLFVGELDTRKRGRLLVRVMDREVRPRVPDAKLWLVCPEQIQGEGLEWFGHLHAADLRRLYGEAWVVCLPSSYEGFGRPYIEAMAAGTPVVATVNPGSREVLDEGRYGMMVADERLGDALVALLMRPDLREQYRAVGLTRAREYVWDAVAGAYEQVYRDVIEGRRHFVGSGL